MDIDDVSAIIRAAEPKIKDSINIIELLSYLKLPIPTEEKIRAESKHQGEPYAASSFFRAIYSRPDKFCTLVAALYKVEQGDIAEILIQETRRHFQYRQDKLERVQRKIDEEKARLGITDNGSGSDSGDPGRDGGNRPRRIAFVVPRVAGVGPCSSQTSPESNKGIPLRSLKAHFHRKLGKELEKKCDADDQNWLAIAETETNLNITYAEVEKIQNSKKPGTEFLCWLDHSGYTLEDLTKMLENMKMQDAVAIVREIENEDGSDAKGQRDKLKMADSKDNRDDAFTYYNTDSSKQGFKRISNSWPSSQSSMRKKLQAVVQPIQVSKPAGSQPDQSSIQLCNRSTSDLPDLKGRSPVVDHLKRRSGLDLSVENLKFSGDGNNLSVNVSKSNFEDGQELKPESLLFGCLPFFPKY